MIVVIGASGFIGTYLVDALAKAGYEVTATGRNAKAEKFYASHGIDFLHVDISNKSDFDKLPQKDVEAVVLLSAMIPANEKQEDSYGYVDVNINGTINTLEYCRKIGCYKLISTTSYFDVKNFWSKDIVIDDDSLRSYNLVDDHSVYVISKNAASDMILHYNEIYGFQGSIFRFPPVYGVGPHCQLRTNGVMRKSGFQIFLEKAQRGETIEIYGDKDVCRDIIYIDDVCDAFVKAIQSDKAKGVYNIMSGESSTLEEQAQAIIEVFGEGKGSTIKYSPEKKNASISYRFSIEKARRDFGFNPKYVPFKKLCEAYKKELEAPRFPHLLPEKTLLILGAGQMQIPVIQAAKAKGYRLVVADFNPEAPGFEYADVKSYCSTIDNESVCALARKENVDGILTTSDYPVNVVAYVGKELGLKAMSVDVARICTNKYLQRKLFKENGINVPYFALCDKNTDLSKFTDFPYIVKPIDSSASRGVSKAENAAELAASLADALEYSRSGEANIESFIGGKEFSVETLTQNGETHIINITEKLTRGEDKGYFVEDTHIEPARISDEEAAILKEEVLKAIKAIGLDNCPSHTEIKLFEGKAYIIEIACRLGGDYITSDLVPLSTGVDMLDNLIRLSMGDAIDTVRKFNKFSCVQFLNDTNYDRCVKFIESKDEHIRRYEAEPYAGDVIKDSLGRLGYIILQADTIKEIEDILERIH